MPGYQREQLMAYKYLHSLLSPAFQKLHFEKHGFVMRYADSAKITAGYAPSVN